MIKIKSSIIYKITINTLLAFNCIIFVIYIFNMYNFSKHSPEVPKLVIYLPGLIFIISIAFLNGIRNGAKLAVYGYMFFILIISILSGMMKMFILYSIVNVIGCLVIFYGSKNKMKKRR